MPEVLPEQQPFSGELGFKYSENLSPEMKRMVRVLTNVSELGSSVDKTAELDKFEKQAFGVRNQLWDEKTDISREFAKILKADETIGDDQRNNIRTGIDNFSGYLRSGDLRRASDQQETVRRQLSQVTDDGERRGLELLSGALELVEAKWRFGRDRELMGQLEVLSREKILDSIDGNLDLVRDATKITRKRDEAGDRADVKGKERHTREIWYTEALKTGFSGKGAFDRESASTEFIREEIKSEGGVEDKGKAVDQNHKFGTGSEEMVNWHFFKRKSLDEAVKHARTPGFLKDQIKIISRVALWADHEWSPVKGLPEAEKLRQWTVGNALVREVWRVLQDNVRAGLTLLENDVTGDMLSCRSKEVFTQQIVDNKAKVIFEYAVDPQKRAADLAVFQQLHDQIEPSFDVTEANTEKLKKKGESLGQEEIIRVKQGGSVEFKIATRNEVFEPMFLYNNKGKIDFNQLEYRVWQARVKLHLLTNVAFDVPDPLRESDAKGPALWPIIEGASAFPNKEIEPRTLEFAYSAFIPTQADFWLMQFYLNQGRDVVANNINSLPEHKRTLVNRFKEVVVKGYYAPAIGKRGEVGVWPDHSKPVSPEITKRRIRNLEYGLMVWPESQRPMLVELPTYIQWNSWKAVAHTTEFGKKEYEDWLRANQGDPHDALKYIDAFSVFFNQKILAGIGLHLSTDLIWPTMAMVNEYYPMVWDEKKQQYKIETNPEELFRRPEGQLWAIYMKQVHEAYQQYIYDNLGISEGIIYDYIRLFLIGKDTPTRDARKIIAPHAIHLWENFVFAKHAQEAWCGNSDFPNEYFGRRVVDVEKLKIGETSNVLGEHFEPAPIDRNLTGLFEQGGEKLSHKEVAALILTVVPDGVIDRHLVNVLLGRKSINAFKEMLESVRKFEQIIWPDDPNDPNSQIKPYTRLLTMIALGETAEGIGKMFGNVLNDVSKIGPVTELVQILQQALYYRAANIESPTLFYETFLFSFAREEVGYYENERWLRINHAYLADVDCWEEIAHWKFKAGPRKGEPIYYHPIFSPGGETLADRYFAGMVPVSSLTTYGEDAAGGWEGGDIIFSIAADTIFKPSAEEERDRILLYGELLRYAQPITIDLASTEFKFSQLHSSLASVDVFRPGVDYALTIKYNQFDRLIDKLRLNAYQKRAIKKVLFGVSGYWADIKRNAQYHILDHFFGRPDWWEKAMEWLGKKSGIVAGGTAFGPILSFLLEAGPIPSFRGSGPGILAMGLTWWALAGSAVVPGWGAAVAGVYAWKIVGGITQWAMSKIYEGKINTEKAEGVNYRYLPSKEYGVDGGLASKRVSNQMRLNNLLCQAPTLFFRKGIPEDHPLRLIRQTQELFEAIAQDQLATS